MAIDRERRIERRIRPKQALFVHYPTYHPRVRDISLSGAFIEDTRPFPVGRMVQLKLWLSIDEPITINTMTRRVEQGQGMGVEFLSISKNDSSRLRRFVGAPAQTL